MHLSPPVAKAAVRSKAMVLLLLTLFNVSPIVGVCNCSKFCCMLLYVRCSIAIILMGKRELVALLDLSSWCLMMVGRLFLAVPRGCLQFVIVVFSDHTHLLFLTKKGEVDAPLNRFKPSSKISLLTVPRQCFFCGSFLLFLSCFVMLSCMSVC